jgi:hypothetical protein
MNHHMLREIAKFLSGAVAGKIVTVLWLSTTGLLPVVLAGTPFTEDAIVPAMFFNVALLAILVYYGWHVKSPVHSPSEKNLLLVAGTIFLLVAGLHFVRLLLGVPVMFSDIAVPLWISWIGVVVAIYLSYASFHFALRMKTARSR